MKTSKRYQDLSLEEIAKITCEWEITSKENND